MVVSQGEKDQMAKLIALMNAGNDEPTPIAESYIDPNMSYEDRQLVQTLGAARSTKVDARVRQPVIELTEKDAMKNILQRLYNVPDETVKDSSRDRELREALKTERTTSGARIGRWEIKVFESSGRKFYNVSAIDDDSLVVAELTLYEAAQGIVRILNDGGTLNSKHAVELLTAENDYAVSLAEAVRFRQRILNDPKGPRAMIFEDRYGESKRKALAAKDRVKKLVD